MTDAELLEIIKHKAKECRHADDACQLVYFINNTVEATGDGVWRSWACNVHHWSGSGPIPKCPDCLRYAT